MGGAPSVSLSISSPTRAHLENLKRLLLQASRYCRHLDWLICSEPPRRHHPTISPLSSRSYVAKTSTPTATQRSPFQHFKETSSQSDNRKWRTFVGGGGGVYTCWLGWRFAHTNSSAALNILTLTSDASWSIFTQHCHQPYDWVTSKVEAVLLVLLDWTRWQVLEYFPGFFQPSHALILHQRVLKPCVFCTNWQAICALFFLLAFLIDHKRLQIK